MVSDTDVLKHNNSYVLNETKISNLAVKKSIVTSYYLQIESSWGATVKVCGEKELVREFGKILQLENNFPEIINNKGSMVLTITPRDGQR